MARTRQAPEVEQHEESEEEAGNEEENEDEGQPLQFSETLTWRAGKPIAVAELLRRLKVLHTELVGMQQEEAHRISLVPVAQELAHANLLGHKDRGIKAWTAACLVDMFRLLAPDAPYKASQLKEIFNLFISTILPALANPNDPYNDQHLKVLTSLNEVKSVILLTDIPGSDGLLVKLFLACFDILSDTARGDGEELSKNVEYHLTGMLVTLVDESESLPTGLADTILAQFLRVDPSTFALQVRKPARSDDKAAPVQLQQLPPAYNMAKNICTACSEKMSRAISQYFSAIIVDASENVVAPKSKKSNGKRRRNSDDDEDADSLHAHAAPHLDNLDLDELEKAHRLLRELWRSAPLVIQNIVPQLDAELTADNVDLRLLATETVGDLISGIGAAGPPPSVLLDPAAYPSQSLEPASTRSSTYNLLTTPAAPHAFSSVHPTAYHSFMNRRNDKSSQIRSMWVTCAGRVLSTSAGGVGLDHEEETDILGYVADVLVDSDEKVRLAAVQAIGRCNFDVILQRFGAHGSINEPGSVLCNLADRIKDRKSSVRTEAMDLLGRIWGVAAGAIAEGSERVRTLLGPIPSKVFEAIYINDSEINKLVQQVLYDSLLPLNYPPIKVKEKAATNGNSQRVRDSQTTTQLESEPNPDALRAERILVLARDLEPRAKTAFFAFQTRQAKSAQYMEALLKRCEEYNGGVTGKDGKEAKAQLTKLVDFFSRTQPDPPAASDHLWKFAKKHDRRCYMLIRFAMSPESDYKKVTRSLKELTKRIEESSGNTSSILATVLPVVRQCSVLVYNKSHVPTIMEISRTDDKGLGAIAHEALREISNNHPEVFKAHVRTLCETLEQQVPSAGSVSDVGTVGTLKACAGFAQRYPAEMPHDRHFLQSMVQFAIHGNPSQAAKHAVSVVVAAEEKRDMYIKDIVSQCTKGFTYGSDDFLSKLAALSQLMLLAAKDVEDEQDNISTLAIQEVLLQSRTLAADDDPAWQDDMDDDCAAKVWALKILVNRLRCYATSSPSVEMETTVTDMAKPVYALLRRVIDLEGELSKKAETPKHHKSRLRLTAAVLLLKLSSHKHFDNLLTAADFDKLATVMQDPLPEVRSAFVGAVKKYLGQSRLPVRFYAMVFLFAFEPNAALKDETMTWLRSRAAAFAKQGDTVLELTFARFLSLLAHHPDFSLEVAHLQDFVEYILFYLKTVATQANLSLIYFVAQRVKSVQDGVDAALSAHLYCLSDIAQAVIRQYEDVQGWSLPAYSEKLRMPSGLFAALPSHAVAQEIADTQYAPEELIDRIEALVKANLRSKKRKADHGSNQAKKRSKPSDHGAAKSTPLRKAVKTPKRRRVSAATETPASEIRRSSRTANAKSYAGMDDSDEDAEMEVEDDEADKENVAGSGDESLHPMIDAAPAGRPLRGAGKKVVADLKKAGKKGARGRKEIVQVVDDSDEELSDPPESDDEE